MSSPQMANYLALDRPRSDAAQPLPLGHMLRHRLRPHSHHTPPTGCPGPHMKMDTDSYVSRTHPAAPSAVLPDPRLHPLSSLPTLGPHSPGTRQPCSPTPFLFWLLATLILGSASVLDQSAPRHRALTSHNLPFTLCIPQHTEPPSTCPLSPKALLRCSWRATTPEHSLPFEPPHSQDALLTRVV